MTHPTEDALLSFALEVIEDPSAQEAIAAHLAGCPECAAHWSRLQRELGIIGGLRPRGRRLAMPGTQPRPARAMVLLRAAALLVVGFALGLGAAERAHRAPAFVAPAYMTLAPPPDSLRPYAVAEGTDAGLALRSSRRMVPSCRR